METYLNGTSSPEEEYYLFKWYDAMQESITERKSVPAEEEEALFMKIQSKITENETITPTPVKKVNSNGDENTRANKFFQTKIAASVALISGLVAGVHFYGRNQSAELNWIHQELSFSNERFEAILPMLEKRYDIQLIIQNPKVKDYRFTGSFKDAGLNTVLNTLQFSNEFRYRKEGEKIIIIY